MPSDPGFASGGEVRSPCRRLGQLQSAKSRPILAIVPPQCPHEVHPAEPVVRDEPKLRWHQLSLRTVMAATTVAAIGLGVRSNTNVAWFVADLMALFALFAVCVGWMEMLRLREEARQQEFWRSFENAQEEFRKASRCRLERLPTSSLLQHPPQSCPRNRHPGQTVSLPPPRIGL